MHTSMMTRLFGPKAVRVGRLPHAGQILCLIALGTAISTPAGGAELRLRTSHESWTWQDETLTELTTDANMRWQLSRSLHLGLTAGYVSLKSEDVADLSGLLDTEARLTYRPTQNLAFGLNLTAPTGKRNLDEEEAVTERRLTNRLLALQTHRLGAGGGVDFSVAYSRRFGGATVGLGVGAFYKGSFEPQEDFGRYQPGTQFAAAGGLEFGDPAWMIRLDGRAIVHTEDQLESKPAYQAGRTIDVEGLALRRWSRVSVWSSVRHIRFADGDYLGSGDVVVDAPTMGDETYAGAGMHVSLRSGVGIDLSVQRRLFAGHDSDLEKASSTDLRGQLSVRVSRTTWLEARTRQAFARLDGRSGQLDTEENTSLTGRRYTLGLRKHF